MKKVLIISASPRKNGNSDLLAQQFAKGATEAKQEVTMVRLAEKKINYCLGCYACTKLGKCCQNDDMNALAKQCEEADVLVFATPVYFYSMTGQLKVFFDRLVQNYTKIRADIYIMITAWDPDTQHLENTIEAIRGMTRDCMEGCPEKGVIIAGDVTELGAIKKHPAFKKAYELGKKC